ncbi:Methyltransferase domain-containing protein [Clostridium cavendishii DSM 21758]|uniref:Methyltransferase domain-containing protein n=1 Tax=Clostridium cavendishii DSM 21758 TaxID=1121302 RepID=A0A1M6G9P4_9CLOT|nr:class I SAM-dependent methyltransferase [Clostridium cavendishii]SHJ06632.1 Methyltransferase domain-containing protein [Clostridium cavendishii DSM 21758]
MNLEELNPKNRFSKRADNYTKYRPTYPKEIIEYLNDSEKYLINYTNFHSVEAASEATTLEAKSIDIITAGQAFHWFEPEATKKEFLRILKPNGFVVIFSNRRKNNSQFMNEYMELVKKYSESEFNKPLNTDSHEFFVLKTIHEERFQNPIEYNLERLKGELASYSYLPNEDDDDFVLMISELELIFEKYNNNGTVIFNYETVVYYCKMK